MSRQVLHSWSATSLYIFLEDQNLHQGRAVSTAYLQTATCRRAPATCVTCPATWSLTAARAPCWPGRGCRGRTWRRTPRSPCTPTTPRRRGRGTASAPRRRTPPPGPGPWLCPPFHFIYLNMIHRNCDGLFVFETSTFLSALLCSQPSSAQCRYQAQNINWRHRAEIDSRYKTRLHRYVRICGLRRVGLESGRKLTVNVGRSTIWSLQQHGEHIFTFVLLSTRGRQPGMCPTTQHIYWCLLKWRMHSTCAPVQHCHCTILFIICLCLCIICLLGTREVAKVSQMMSHVSTINLCGVKSVERLWDLIC